MPNKDKNIPKRRFKAFENADAWELRKLGEFVDKAVDNRGKTPPLDEEGTHPLIEVAALGGVHPDYTKIDKYLNDESFENNLRSYIKKDDILFTTVGSIGLVSLMDSREEAAIAQNIVAFRAKDNFVPSYLYSLFTNKENQLKAIRIVMGAVQPSIKVSQLVDVEYMLTQNRFEQKAIGTFFSTLDRQITLHQRKLDKLKNVKQAYLSEMFPAEGERVPKRRFPGFTDDWELRKLGDIGEIVTGSTPPVANPEYYSSDTGIPWITPTDIETNIISDSAKKLSVEGAKVGRVVQANSILCTCIASIGKNALLTTIGSFNQQINALTPYPNNDSYFLLTSSELWSIQMKQIASSGTMQIINKTEFSELRTMIPSLPEQEAIGTFFSALDQQITLHQRKLEKLKNLKKALLNELFV
ncbi:TPA: restriction endonuclease subunit S [Streptococcus suis]